MRSLILPTLLVSLLPFTAWCEQPPEVAKVTAAYVKAHLERDSAKLETILCDDYAMTGIDGKIRDKSKILAMVSNDDIEIQTAKRETKALRKFGDTVIWTGTSHTKGTNKEKAFEHKGAFTTVLVKQDGTWKFASDQVTPLATNDISGAWKLFGRLDEDGDVVALGEEGADALSMKLFSNGRWFITYVDTTTADVTFHHGGTYKLDGNKYEEEIEFATEATQTMVGNTLKFTMEVEGDVLTQRGIGNPYNEVWHRVVAKSEAKAEK